VALITRVFTMRGKLRVERDAPMPNERIACPKCGFPAAWMNAEKSYTCLNTNCAHWFK
jgi:hypothetical protein